MILERIKNLREDTGVTEEQIARLLNVTKRTYTSYEKGKSKIRISQLIILANFYDVPIDYILNMTDIKARYK